MIEEEHFASALPQAKSSYNFWTLLGPTRKEESFWNVKCICICGQVKWVRFFNIVDGTSKSCGCQKHIWRPSKVLYKEQLCGIKKACQTAGISYLQVWRKVVVYKMTHQEAFDDTLKFPKSKPHELVKRFGRKKDA